VLVACLLLGSGGPHGTASSTDRILDASSKLGPLSAQAKVNASNGRHRYVHALRFAEAPTTVVTHPTPETTVTTVTTVIVKATTTTTVTRVTTTTAQPSTTTTTPHIVAAVAAPTTTTTVVHTTTTTVPSAIPSASSNGSLPDAPASLGAPSAMVLDDEFDTGALNTTLWAPSWYGNKVQQNQTTMSASNVSVNANGLQLTAAGNSTGGIVSSNPQDDQPGHVGFQIAPSPGKPVYVEFKVDIPAAGNGEIANWPAVWLVGDAPWPENGEIDVMEGLGGYAAYHLHFGDGNGEGADGPGQPVNSTPGIHTYGVLWTTTGITFVYDGAVVGTLNDSLTSPMHLVMENSIGSYMVTLPTTMTVRYVRVWQ
jgi:beta-glucanase (GH16 family)